MQELDSLKNKQKEQNAAPDRINGILKPVAAPYKELAHADKIRENTYNVPEGLTEEAAMLLTFGAMVQDEMLDKMHSGDTSPKSTHKDFKVSYLYENIFVGTETEGRLGNVPIIMGEARKYAADAFVEFGEGKKEKVQKMGQALVKRLYEGICDRTITNNSNTIVQGQMAKRVLNLMNTHPELGIQNALTERQREQLQAFSNACEIQSEVLAAEIQAQENLPTAGSDERKELLKNVWMKHAVLVQMNKDMAEKDAVLLMQAEVDIKMEIKGGTVSQVSNDPTFNQLQEKFHYKLSREMLLPSQMVLSNKEYTNTAMDTYWEQMQQSPIYKQLMNADENTFFSLLEEERKRIQKEGLPKVPGLNEALKDKISANDQIVENIKEEFSNGFKKIFPELKKRIDTVESGKELLRQLEKEMSSDRLAGSMKTMQDYLSVVKDLTVTTMEKEKYQAYLEAMQQVVNKTEELYEKNENGEYVPLTKENLKELQDCYKKAYSLAKEIKQEYKAIRVDIICNVLEQGIVALGTIDKKNLTTLPKAMEASKTVVLDVTEDKLKKVGNNRFYVEYTDINGEKKKGVFREQKEKRDLMSHVIDKVHELNKKYPNLKPFGDFFLKVSRQQPNIAAQTSWAEAYMGWGGPFTSMETKEAKANILQWYLDHMKGDYKEEYGVEMPEDIHALMENNKEDAQEYLIEVMEEVTEFRAHAREFDFLKLPEDKTYRLDTRNAAMSSIAEMLGVPDLVVKAKPMRLRNANNQPIVGTFTEAGEGEDITKLPEDHPMRNYGPKVYNTGSGIKSLADMQVLDYICMNGKRTASAMLYQFDTTTDPENPKLIGVQGINNEFSFGLSTSKVPGELHVTELNNLCVISQSVFDALMDIDEETFRLSLREKGLVEEEANAACIRLKNLKNKVINDKKDFDGKETGYLEEGKIRIIPDAEFENLKIEQIVEASPNAKLFKNVQQQVMNGIPYNRENKNQGIDEVMKKISELSYGKEEQKVNLDITEVNLASKDYYTKLRRELGAFLLETTRADSVLRGSSKEYKGVQKALKDSMELLGKIEDNPKPEEIKNVKESLERITDATTAYKIHKERVHSGSDYEKTRISVMNKIATSIDGKKNTLEAESKKHVSNLENDARRVERRAENKNQIKECVNNLRMWSKQALGNDLKKALGAAIVAGNRTEYALQKYNMPSANPDPAFQMTKEQFDKAVDDLINTPQFETYYNDLSKEKLARELGTNQALEVYSRDFRENALNMQVPEQPQQEQRVNEQVRVHEQKNNIIPNM